MDDAFGRDKHFFNQCTQYIFSKQVHNIHTDIRMQY